MKNPNILSHDQVIRNNKETKVLINDRWVACRPINYTSWQYRLRAALLVFTGKADALIWPEAQ